MTPLDAYSRLMCRAIWAFRRFFPAGEGELPDVAVTKRDFEWQAKHRCEVCGVKCKHRFISWVEPAGEIVTAECSNCGFEASVS